MHSVTALNTIAFATTVLAACDPVGCYPDTSFSVIGSFQGNDQIPGNVYYQNVDTSYTWICNNNYNSATSNLPYVWEISGSVRLYCDDRYDQTKIKYGAISGALSDLGNCADTGDYTFRCIFNANGETGSATK